MSSFNAYCQSWTNPLSSNMYYLSSPINRIISATNNIITPMNTIAHAILDPSP